MATLDLYLENFHFEQTLNEAGIHPQAQTWCDYVKKIMVATGVLDNRVRKSSLWSPFYLGGRFNVRHLFKKLAELNIVDECEQPLSFFSLNKEERYCFVDQMLEYEAQDLTEKIKRIPQLSEYLSIENQWVHRMMLINGIESVRTEREEQLMKQNGSFDIYANYPHCPISDVKIAWNKGKVKRGDLLVTLPKHGYPWIFANLNPRYTHKMGHVAIITRDIEENTDIYSKCTVECMLKKGVHERTMKNWDMPHYVMGIQKITWHWKGDSGLLRKEVTPVEEVSALAEMAEKFIGRSYVRWYEVVTCKWVAPLRFTCSTLIWWSAKKVYGFSISNWLYAFTTPTDILRNPATYIKAEVR